MISFGGHTIASSKHDIYLGLCKSGSQSACWVEYDGSNGLINLVAATSRSIVLETTKQVEKSSRLEI